MKKGFTLLELMIVISILAVFISVAYFLAAAGKTPALSSAQSTNREVNLELLFENDGVKVYRFSDYGHRIYYTDARGRTSWDDTRTSGKTTVTEHHDVDTVR